ncbi:MAG: DUF4339 domain-containing protein [Verrucomicrobiales bacterium]|nr:DUF4339 domain-containing protein [Verrucomicrobiales bacterium]
MSELQIHITRKGEQHGPYPEANAREMLAAGQLLPTDLAWHAGADGWKPLSEILGAATQPPATPPPSPPPPGGGMPKRTMAGAAPAEEKPAEEKPEDSEPDDPDKISVARKGESIGPYSREKAKEYFASGQLLPTDWGWHDGMDDWKPINEVLGMAAPAQTTAAAGKPGKGKKVAIIVGIVVLLSGLIFAGITYGPDLVAKISGGSLAKNIIGKWKEVKDKGTFEFSEGGTVIAVIKIAGKSVETEGSYEFISKDRMKTKFNFMGKTMEDEQLVSIEGDTLTLTTIDPDTGKEDPTKVDKYKRVE